MDELRARYLRDKVLTASPAQRVVMLYDRLALDLRHARGAADLPSAGSHLGHAASILAELHSSLNMSAGGPAENLATLYPFLIHQLMDTRTTGNLALLDVVDPIVAMLRDAWAHAAAGTTESDPVGAGAVPVSAASSWVS